MKTNITFFVIILMVIAELTVAAVYVPAQVSQTVVFETSSESKLVRAEIIDGELMPVVDLPTVEITANSKPIIYLPVHIVGNDLMAFINLPEIEILGDNGIAKSEPPVTIVDLPQINIVGSSQKDNMVRVEYDTDSQFTLLADLPEVIIYGYEVSTNIQPPLIVENHFKFNTIEHSKTLMLASKKFELNGFYQANNDCVEFTPVTVNFTIKKKQKGVMILVANNRYFVPGTLHNEILKVEQHIN